MGGVILRSTVENNNLYFPEGVAYEDNAVGFLYYLVSKKIVYIDKSYYYYRINNQSTTHTFSKKVLLDRIVTSDLLIQNAKDIGIYERYKDMIDGVYISLMVGPTTLLLLKYVRPLPISNIKEIYSKVTSCDPNWRNHKYYRKHPNKLVAIYIDYLLPSCVPFWGCLVQFIIRIKSFVKKK